jgi:hypothetical protein
MSIKEKLFWMNKGSEEAQKCDLVVDDISNEIQKRAHEAKDNGNYDEAVKLMDRATKAMCDGFCATSKLKATLNEEEYNIAMEAWEAYYSEYSA